jgi:hypothetical protein
MRDLKLSRALGGASHMNPTGFLDATKYATLA